MTVEVGLTVSGLAFTSESSEAFSVDLGVVLPLVIPPGETAKLTINFTPYVSGSAEAVLSINSDDASDPAILLGTGGNGLACDINASPLVLDFGVVGSGSQKSQVTMLSNNSKVDCAVTDLVFTGSEEFTLGDATSEFPFVSTP